MVDTFIPIIQMRKVKFWHKMPAHTPGKRKPQNVKLSGSDCDAQCSVHNVTCSPRGWSIGVGSGQGDCWGILAAKIGKEWWKMQVYLQHLVRQIIRTIDYSQLFVFLCLSFQLSTWFPGPRTMHNWVLLDSVFYWLEVDNMDFTK